MLCVGPIIRDFVGGVVAHDIVGVETDGVAGQAAGIVVVAGGAHRAGQLLRAVWPVIGQLILVGVVAGIGIVVGLVLIIVPGLILITIWSVAAPVVVLERPGGLAALGRSRELVRGNGWNVFAVILLLVVLVSVVSFVIEGIANSAGTGVGLVVRVVVGILTAPISSLAAAVLYFELRGAPAGGGTVEPDPSGPFQAGGFPPAAP